jgi:hypothetical protein
MSAVFAVLVAAVSGCATQTTPEPAAAPTLSAQELAEWTALAEANPGTLGPGEGEAEYDAAVAAFPLPLPSGYAFPHSSTLRFYTPGGVLERGAGTGYAAYSWLCAAQTAYLDADGDTAREAALDDLRDWAALPSDVITLRNAGDWAAAVLDPAAAGDDEPLEADARSNCGEFPAVRE